MNNQRHYLDFGIGPRTSTCDLKVYTPVSLEINEILLLYLILLDTTSCCPIDMVIKRANWLLICATYKVSLPYFDL